MTRVVKFNRKRLVFTNTYAYFKQGEDTFLFKDIPNFLYNVHKSFSDIKKGFMMFITFDQRKNENRLRYANEATPYFKNWTQSYT